MTSAAFGVVILAAGNSSRLGQPKQLLTFNGKSLIRHAATETVKAAGEQVIVVTGANKDLVEVELHPLSVQVIHNEYWREGMASSIHTGLITLLNIFPQLDAVLFSVCDQPYLSAALFNKMVREQQITGKGIIASVYNHSKGVPVLFNHQYFGDLVRLDGRSGAKELLHKFRADVAGVPFPGGAVDIDTMADYNKLIHSDD
jgi:molybdenum cofactor cytidylyltransferase